MMMMMMMMTMMMMTTMMMMGDRSCVLWVRGKNTHHLIDVPDLWAVSSRTSFRRPSDIVVYSNEWHPRPVGVGGAVVGVDVLRMGLKGVMLSTT